MPARRAPRGLRARLRSSGLEARVRLGVCAAAVAVGWALGRCADWLSPRAGREARRRARLERAAARVVRTLGALKGAFAKAGQFAAARHDVFPPAALEALASLRDRVPPLPLDTIQRSIERELGAPLLQLFARFDPEPIGAASVAQVHRAQLPAPGGREVAVKVQYPWIEASLPSDLALIRRWLARGLRWSGRNAEIDLLFDEYARGLAGELDFEREAAIAREIAANLAGDEQIVVPEIVPTHTCGRVLTMSHHEGIPIDDLPALERAGVDRAEVLQILARAYAQQVFVDGLFHADPHPGNLFVLREPGMAVRPRVLFVDFGLSRRLDDQLRRAMREAIHALLQRDAGAFVDHMDALGMIQPGARDGVEAAVRTMFERVAQSGGALGMAGSAVTGLKDQAKALLADTPGLQLPNDLLLYAKTLSYLFALGERLAPEVDLMKLSLPFLLRFLTAREEARETSEEPRGLSDADASPASG